MSFTSAHTYIDAPSLAERIQAGDVSEKKLAVVDVRDDDFEGGAIAGARNVPSATLPDNLDSLVKDLAGVPKVVFHCHLSQQRGPKAARLYTEARNHAIETGAIDPKTESGSPQQVVVLRDGAAGFVRQYKDDKSLVENYDARSWEHRE
ncbi:unnamed protein product [Tilletia controversa]|uniref:Rhodanese domain-containing protein n=3 Tax=Tilletia TaxID=13289 RepID=A0A8X7SZN8_9BASI|nr:hypothetical protein CF336_g2376 [Tilletia laevis]KAE8200258.1 hypothetical protein CF328_g3017 [Tilletia controversa]KAE8263295.1 hypothetical protein A4X03_0g1788 [Tilletia caries]KAE8205129.1 hypothetical protein CF335_g2412 [Tilletia laevis]KAE8252819.1 hypothetical protein A4X06_0g1905 [Tilletia controversa]